MIEAAAGVPLGPLIAMRGYASGVFEHARQVHEVPGHECRVAVGEIVLRSPRTRIEVRRTGPGRGISTGGCLVRFINPDGPGFRVDCLDIVPNGAVINYAIIH